MSISKPVSPAAAANLAKVVSKMSAIVANLIEFNTIELLNGHDGFMHLGKWERQDPGFPDAIFRGKINPVPGIEIKAWFPLATEITARFRDSQTHFEGDNIDVALLAWLPEHLVYGKPYILAVTVVSALSVARTRDAHYHKPPDYLVLEPGNTTARTRNLQQTNTAGYKWQGTDAEFGEAEQIVNAWGAHAKSYQPTPEYQKLCQSLMSRYPYRLDTNFAKIDRIVHPEIESFKARVLATQVHGQTVQQWSRLLCSRNTQRISSALAAKLDVKEADADNLIR